MRPPILALTVPLLFLAAASASFLAPVAAAADATYSVSGRVTSDQGFPLQGVTVHGYTYHDKAGARGETTDASAATDADGRYTLELGAGKGYINVHYEKWRAGDGRELEVAGDLTNVDFQLKTPPPKDATVKGRILGPDGKPIADAEVSISTGCCYAMPAEQAEAPEPTSKDAPSSRVMIMPPHHDDWQSVKTDADGAYEFQTYAGPRQVTAWAKGYGQTSEQVEAKSGEAVTADIKLEKVPGVTSSIEGRVVDSQTGLPVRGAHVSIRNLEWSRWAGAETDELGRFELKAIPGWTEITIHHYGQREDVAAISADIAIAPHIAGNKYYPHSRVVDLADGKHDLEIKLDPKPRPTITLIGYVIDPDQKKGIEGVQISVWNQATGDWGEAKTDATGSYKILVNPGHYTANVWKEGYLSGQQSFVVDKDGTQRVDLILPKGTHKWAPCYDAECDGGYGRDYAIAEAKGAPAPMPQPAQAPTSSRAQLESSDSRAAAGPDRSRGASFSGEGGGLPPYDPNEVASSPGGETSGGRAAAAQEVPWLGAAVLALVLAGVAIVTRRRG